MTVRRTTRVATLLVALLYGVVAVAQTPAPSPKKAPPSPKAPAAPQVVTIIHRLNGLKMFRLLLRSEQQVQSVGALDSAFSLLDDVHTNVIAGLTMDDGETIVAWLPEAEVEFGPAVIPPAAPRAPRAPRAPVAPLPRPFFDTPDITVIGPEGKRLAAKYIGLDAVTGLSILRLTNKNAAPVAAIKDEPGNAGQTVLLFSPQPVPKIRTVVGAGVYARMVSIEGRIQ